MWEKSRNWLHNLWRNCRPVLIGPQTLAFLPALILCGYWFGGETVIIIAALVIPAVFAAAGLFSGTGPAWTVARDGNTGMVLRASAEKALDHALDSERKTGLTTAAIALQLDDIQKLEKQVGVSATHKLLKQSADRIAGAVRDADVVAKLDEGRFAIALAPVRRADMEMLIQLSARIQNLIAEPYSIAATRVYVTASVGFCLPSQLKERSGKAMLEAANSALEVARSYGAGSIRTYSKDLKRRVVERDAIHAEVAHALETDQIKAWFQPQVSTDTGHITGLEALARWEHPDRGIILPGDFLPAIAEQNLQLRLGEIILSQSLRAMREWDKTGQNIDRVSVNFASQELEDPKISEKIRWELDRYGLEPKRLCVEILEDVVAASDNSIVIQNIAAISEMGCAIDLDDFGTGSASISNIRRFGVDRIKIDHSFVTRLDRDREQQDMVAAVLTMANQLNVETVAEGVETIGEHAMLAQLGCGHVQGFSVARPMPFDHVEGWVAEHRAKLTEPPNFSQKAV